MFIGGQRARLSLARALFSDAPLLLLDDIFSSLDSTTSISVWNNVFCSSLLSGRTVVLVTQLPWIAAEGDCVVTMKNGRATSATNTATRQPKSFAVSGIQNSSGNSAKAIEGKYRSNSEAKGKSTDKIESPRPSRHSRFQCMLLPCIHRDAANYIRDQIHRLFWYIIYNCSNNVNFNNFYPSGNGYRPLAHVLGRH